VQLKVWHAGGALLTADADPVHHLSRDRPPACGLGSPDSEAARTRPFLLFSDGRRTAAPSVLRKRSLGFAWAVAAALQLTAVSHNVTLIWRARVCAYLQLFHTNLLPNHDYLMLKVEMRAA
jgi:hypothetical protein